jgi:hypothetical protein
MRMATVRRRTIPTSRTVKKKVRKMTRRLIEEIVPGTSVEVPY